MDDDESTRNYLGDFLSTRGYEVQSLDSGEQAIRRLSSGQRPALLLLDIRMPHIGGLDVLAQLEKTGRRVPAIVLSGVDQVSTVVKAMRLGASDYLVKPLNEEDLERAVAKTIAEYPAADFQEISPLTADVVFPSTNRRMLQIKAICDQVARADVPVLLLGESGVGKEVLARYIHCQSGREEPFVKVNCAALPADLLESELFGHERGAFTGAMREKPGKFELAGEGTLMLDEIGEMSPLLQAKLLHILQDGEYARLGGTRPMRSDARILAATNKRLQELVSSGTFREDLYFRLNVITIEVPPLRERPEDILPLCRRFVERYRAKYRSSVHQLPGELEQAFARFHWPGNVRQLENAVRRFLILPDLPQALAELQKPAPQREMAPPPPDKLSLKELSAEAAERAEKEVILRTLEEVNWNRKQAARKLNICYKSLLNKLRRWQLGSRPELEDSEEAQVASAGERGI
ncbi:MAG TPA: sigma-54 dependent transcriptional regulator [Bryobacteraceae bacterium]|nr:sigma-54 dependent transcriptional regulator [Bryobacteraceae bacterium]